MSVYEGPRVEHFFYRSAVDSRHHRNRVSAYLVHRFEGSVVLARIEPLGLVPTSLGDHAMALQGLRRNLQVSGAWEATPSHHHTRVRLAPMSKNPKAAPRSP